MSEAERKRRLEYREKRHRWIIWQVSILAVLLVLTFVCTLFAVQCNRMTYINYRESSQVEYGVYVKENDFYKESFLSKEYEYVASLIDKVVAEFIYDLYVGADSSVEYTYTYRVDAILEIRSKISGKTIYSSAEEVIPARRMEGSGQGVTVRESVTLDYVKYNQLASGFISRYGLKETVSNLVVQMHVDVAGSNEAFQDGQSKKSYVASLDIPLTTQTVDVKITSDTPDGNGQLPARRCGTVGTVLRVLAIVLACLSALLGIGMACFIYLTRNTDITYEIQVKRLLRDYKSYIQTLRHAFDPSGYQLLQLNSFAEMLEIRDIIQSPILMSENEDRTRTEFLIPTNTRILYMYEIKVSDYDEIYAQPDRKEPEDQVVILDENVDQEALDEALSQPEVVLADIDYVKDTNNQWTPSPEDDGVEVIGVVWPERANKNKVYRYDPNGEVLHEGDTVLVPTRDTARNKDVIRKAAVAQGNYKVASSLITHPLKKIIGIIKRKAEEMLTSDTKNP